MKKSIISIVSIAIALHTTWVQAKTIDSVVVTATKTQTNQKEIASSMVVISEETIANSKAATVTELLRNVPGLDIVQSGGSGSTASVFLRGANSEHTLVMIDGIKANDVISAGRRFDFDTLSASDIEKIEIVKGPQSTLYGSDAMVGVINIITKKGQQGRQINFNMEAGSFETYKENISLGGANDKVNYFLNLARIDSKGFSTAGNKYGNTEKDGYKNTFFSSNIGLQTTQNTQLDLILKFTDSQSDIDNGSGAGQDDINHILEGTELLSKADFGISLWDNKWKQNFELSYIQKKRKDTNIADEEHPNDLLNSTFEAKSLMFEWKNVITPNELNTIATGIEYTEERGASTYYSESTWGPYSSDISEKTADIKGIYLQDQIKIAEKFFPTIGIRYDKHSKAGNKTTYKIAPAYIVEATNTKIKGSYGSGFKTPSLYQLYSPYGSTTLEPEKSKGYDFGIEQLLLEDKLSLELVYFHNDFTNLIDYDYDTSKYLNISKAETKGLEFTASTKLIDKLMLALNYTYTKTLDKDENIELKRRPKHKANLTFNYSYSDKCNSLISINYVGERKNNDYSTSPATIITKDAYTLVDFITSYNINEHIEVYGKILNLFNKSYEEVNGFGTADRTLWIGTKLKN